MVLLTTLILIAILTGLMLSLMQSVLLYYKVIAQVTRQHDLFYELERVTHQVQLDYQQGRLHQCIVQDSHLDETRPALRPKPGCVLTQNNHTYPFLIEDLGDHPCLRGMKGDRRHASHHVRITVLSSSLGQAYLQIRVAEPATQVLVCTDAVTRLIPWGVISWRYVSMA